MSLKTVRGTKDVMPSESYQWHYIEGKIREVTALHGFQEIRTPTFEYTELFLRGVGETTDIVSKEMYTFDDKGGRSLTLKPEGTAGVGRAFIEHGMTSNPQPSKMYYLNCPVFRYEAPQAGRLREHHQFGAEMFGPTDASADAEMILMASELFQNLGATSLSLHINNIGCRECRPVYHKALREYFAQYIEQMCSDCQVRYEKNPLRILDCKNEKCRVFIEKAPTMQEYACETCSTHFNDLQEYLKSAGQEFVIDPYIVRGLDYYTRTVFEFISTHIGSQGTVCGGGRYDHLIEELGGSSVPGIGFGMGMERLLMLLEGQGIEIPKPKVYDIYLASTDETSSLYAFTLAAKLRENGIKAETNLMKRSVKAQMKYADKLSIPYVVVLGEDELARKVAICKNMDTGEGVEFSLENSLENLLKILR